ncbi:MAG: hypothetical protein KDD99_13700 [Bacteroidetes bacterium]|nr:hypothetical protein [Bacteroidota bacterium]
MAKDHKKTVIQRFALQILGTCFYTLYLLGALFPTSWWGTHFIAFLPPLWKYFFLIISGALIVYSFVKPNGFDLKESWQGISENKGNWLIGGITILIGIFMYQFPISGDYYGDAYKLVNVIHNRIDKIPPGTNDAFFTFSLSPWAGHSSVLAVVTYLAYFFGMTYQKAFLWLDTICGMLFVLSWLSFLRYYLENVTWKIILGLAGLTAPFMLIYFGHIESYAPVFLLFILWLMGTLIYLQSRKTSLLWGLVILLFICMKAHPVASLFLPAMGLLMVSHYFGEKKWGSYLLSAKGMMYWVLLPIFAIGAILYFFVFEDHKDPRELISTDMASERLFLPLFSPDPPLDKYNLLSFNHVFDYFNELFIWSPIALFLVIALLFFSKGKDSGKRFSIRITGLSLILFGSLFFMINPLLSMQMDWDLLAIPAPVFLTFTVVLVKELKPEKLALICLPICLALSFLTIPNFILHQTPTMHSQRLERLGVRMYITYYEWSSKVINYALRIPKTDRETYEKRKQKIIAELRPFATQNIDFEFARLLIEEGKYYLRIKKDYEKALSYLEQASPYFPYERNGLLYSMEGNFLLKRYQKAFENSLKLIDIGYPDEAKSFAIAIQCALEAELYKEALSLSEIYIKNWNDKASIQTVYERLNTGENIGSLKYLFARPE